MSVSIPSQLLNEQRALEIRDIFRSVDDGAYAKTLSNLARDIALFADAVRKPVADASLEPVRRLAHSLKGASLSLGAQALGAIFDELERLAREGDAPGLVQFHADSVPLITQSQEALRILDGRPA